MKKNKLYRIFLYTIFFAVLFSSCEKDADVKLPSVEQKLVVHSFISPQDLQVDVIVSLSEPVFNSSNNGGTYSRVVDATVKIIKGISVYTLQNLGGGQYSVSTSVMPVVAGETYELIVTTPDGKSVNAFTTIPQINNTLTFAVTPTSIVDEYSIKASWQDDIGENYYRISHHNISNGLLYALNVISDANSDGAIINRSYIVYHISGQTEHLYLSHISKEYYLYSKKLESLQNESPFAEPVQSYSNINGGFGVFASYNQYKQVVFN